MTFSVTYASFHSARPHRTAPIEAVDIDVAARRAVENCPKDEFVVRVEQPDLFDTAELDLELIPDPGFIPLGYSIGSAELPHGRTLDLVAAGSSVFFRVSGRHAYVKLDLSGPATRAAAMLTEEEVPA